MKKIHLIQSIIVGLAPALLLAKEPTNLAIYKSTLQSYHDSGDYFKDLSESMKNAQHTLKQAILAHPQYPHAQPAMVLDIDETSLSNYREMAKLDFGGTMDQIETELDKGKGIAITPTLKLYQFAKSNHIAVFFITGRIEAERNITAFNLKKAGYSHWDGLILRTKEYEKKSASAYKTAMRKKLTEKGYNIVLNIGDQQSDLSGGYAKTTIKLPNPYYFIP